MQATKLRHDNFLMDNYDVMGKLSGPIMVSFDVTTECMMKCVHCYNNSGMNIYDSKELTNSEILEVAHQIVELNPYTVCICGGEPLCRSNLLNILDVLSSEIKCISMVSNGFLMTDEIAKSLKERNVKQIQISLDGIDYYQHDNFRGVKGAFRKAVEAIEILKDNKFNPIATSFVPNKLNYQTIDKYIDLCVLLGVDLVRIMPFIPSGRGKSIGNKLRLNDCEYFYFLRKMLKKSLEYAEIIEIEWGDPIDHLRRMPHNAYNGLNTYCMEVKSDGDVTVTTYLPIVVGNIKRHTLKDYWKKGYNFIWRNPDVIKHVNKILTIEDFSKFEPAPYTGEKIEFDIIDDLDKKQQD